MAPGDRRPPQAIVAPGDRHPPQAILAPCVAAPGDPRRPLTGGHRDARGVTLALHRGRSDRQDHEWASSWLR
jgi:hypothetical protein